MKPHRSLTCALWSTVLSAGLLTLGCEQAPPPIDGKIRIVDPGRPAEVEGAGPLLLDRNPVKWLSRRVSVPLVQPLDEPWESIDEAVLPALARAAWNGNGLRVGVLPAARVPAFASALGKPFEEIDTQLISYDFLEEIRESPPLRAEFTADLTVPPNPVTLETFTRGRLRMLMSSRPLGNGLTRVTLTPQHHRPRTTLIPRTLEERIKDGRVFEELSVQLNIGPRDVLVLGYYRPAPIEPTEDTESDADHTDSAAIEENPETVESEPTETEAEAEVETEIEIEFEGEAAVEPPPVLSLGIGLFTTGLTEDDLQYLYLLRPLP